MVWFAGIHLAKTTDILSRRFKLGEALGGIIVLAVVTNLPEIAITISAETGHRLGFSNLSHFGRLFEKYYGAKPKRFGTER